MRHAPSITESFTRLLSRTPDYMSDLVYLILAIQYFKIHLCLKWNEKSAWLKN